VEQVRLCDLVVRFLGYRSGDSGSIPGTTENKKVVGLERGPLSLVRTTEELLDRKVAPRGTLCPQKLAITSPTSGGRSVAIVRSRTQTIKFVCFVVVSGRVTAGLTQCPADSTIG
jgi:hypothetical protein